MKSIWLIIAEYSAESMEQTIGYAETEQEALKWIAETTLKRKDARARVVYRAEELERI